MGAGLLSSDGRTLAFIRATASFAVAELFVMPAEGGDAPLPARGDHRILTAPACTAHGRELVFYFARGGAPSLWRVPASGGEPRSAGIGGIASELAVSAQGERMAFKAVSDTGAIWRSQLGRVAPPAGSAPAYSAKGHIFSPRVSLRQGNRLRELRRDLAVRPRWFQRALLLRRFAEAPHARAGRPDGSHDRVRLPLRWSPGDLVHRTTSGGLPRLIRTVPGAEDEAPNWSADGRWIYFASRRRGGSAGLEGARDWWSSHTGDPGRRCFTCRSRRWVPLLRARGLRRRGPPRSLADSDRGRDRVSCERCGARRTNELGRRLEGPLLRRSEGDPSGAPRGVLRLRHGHDHDRFGTDPAPRGSSVFPGGRAVVYADVDYLSQIMVVEGFR